MSIKSYLNELDGLNRELTNLSSRRKELAARKKQIESDIQEYLQTRNQPGVKHGDVAIIVEEKNNRIPKKKQEKYQDGISVLQKYGLAGDNAEHILNELLESQRGVPTKKHKLKIVKNKSKK